MDSYPLLRSAAKHINRLLGQPDIDALSHQLQTHQDTLAKTQAQHKALSQILTKIRASLDANKLFEIVTRDTCRLLNVERVAVYRFTEDWSGKFVSTYTTTDDTWDEVSPFGRDRVWEDSYLQETQGGRYRMHEAHAVADIYHAGHAQCHLDLLEQYRIRAFAIAPIFNGMKLWGLLGIYQHSGTREWAPIEIDFLRQVGSHLGIAIQQSDRMAQLKAKTEALTTSADRQQSLTEVVSKIRSSLDVEQILNITCEETRSLVTTDRLAVYRFEADWSGEFVAHHGTGTENWDEIAPFGKGLRWEDTFLQETQGGPFRYNETAAINDIYEAGLSRCHIDILKQFKVRAYAIAPIFVEHKLWGLLGAYEHHSPRAWTQADVDFLAQIGSQLGVAIQSSLLLSETQGKAEDLEQAAEQRQTLYDVVSKIRETLAIETINTN